ncbi:TetR/AcrR family transcriptional regulator [Nocardia sp. CNY236]|uniref:TetR/AcrR family transcriptional regulator n=1 Tax=Nocardia sp. CNY236 TaxID=1169152 RepID=UPI0009DD2006|nr:TetR/AcrR family transcriptional regulator [Nocardia sp. CNY236]
MSTRSRRAYRTGLSRALIVDAAQALTVERGLAGWGMRDVAARLDTSLSVIYHHVGDRDAVCAAVVDRVYAEMDLQLDTTNWRELLHGVLTSMIDHLSGYPGVATWLLRNGPQTEALLPVLDAGVTLMLEAGWGEESAAAYSVAFNTCLGLIALGDQQIGAADPGLSGLLDMLDADSSAGPGAKQMQQMVERFTTDAEREATRREYCRYALERVLDGLQVRLDQLTSGPVAPR